ncbi:MAG: hypothetical protein VB088_15065 [Sphaerochaeta sp.]|nr:hypothetical protein [Sphaerochaeta sp.]
MGRRQLPLIFCIQQETEILDMVIAIVGQDIGHNKAKHLFTLTISRVSVEVA